MSTIEKGQLLADVRTRVSDPEEKFGRKTFSGLNIGTMCFIQSANSGVDLGGALLS